MIWELLKQTIKTENSSPVNKCLLLPFSMPTAHPHQFQEMRAQTRDQEVTVCYSAAKVATVLNFELL